MPVWERIVRVQGRGPASLNSGEGPDGSFDHVQQVHLIPNFVKTPLRNVHNIFTHTNRIAVDSAQLKPELIPF